MNIINFGNTLKILFEAKSKIYTLETINSWYYLLKDYPEEKVIPAMLELAKEPDDFINVGKIINKIKPSKEFEAEEVWEEVLASAQNGGRLSISIRAGKALNRLGGMQWLRDSDPEKVDWQRKTFMEVYANTLENPDNDFKCIGLKAEMYLPKENEKTMELNP